MRKALPLLIMLLIGYTLRPQIDSVLHPVKPAPPVAIVKAQEPSPTATPSATPTPTPMITQTALAKKVVDYIWMIESGRGTADHGWAVECAKIGKWNEIGYGGSDFCFDSKEQGFAILRREIEARLAKNGLIETMCVYNLGFLRDQEGKRIPYTTCDYYQNFEKTL